MKAAGALVPLAREARKLLRSDKYSAGISEEKRRFKGRTDLSYYGTPNVVHLANCLALLVETAGRQKGIFGKRLPLESFERYARRVLTGKVITEIGCGGGSLALVLQDLGSKVQGVEYYKELAEFARNRGIHVVRGVAHRLDQYESLGPPHFIISNNVFSADLYLPPELRNKKKILAAMLNHSHPRRTRLIHTTTCESIFERGDWEEGGFEVLRYSNESVGKGGGIAVLARKRV